MKLLRTITIPQYIRDIKLAEKTRKKYYRLKIYNGNMIEPKLPVKYSNKEKFDYNESGILINLKTKEQIIANPNHIGNPRYHRISGNEIISGGYNSEFIRLKIKDSLYKHYDIFTKDILPIDNEDFPIFINWEIHCEVEDANWDLSNLFIYNKYFEDILVKKGIIPDDSIKYITGSARPVFYPIENNNKRKFVFKIYKDERSLVQEHKLWQRNHTSVHLSDLDF